MPTASISSARASSPLSGPGCVRGMPRRQTRSSRTSGCWMMTEPPCGRVGQTLQPVLPMVVSCCND
eukprot:116586-Alexandrium_andersonii.AAC.1